MADKKRIGHTIRASFVVGPILFEKTISSRFAVQGYLMKFLESSFKVYNRVVRSTGDLYFTAANTVTRELNSRFQVKKLVKTDLNVSFSTEVSATPTRLKKRTVENHVAVFMVFNRGH